MSGTSSLPTAGNAATDATPAISTGNTEVDKEIAAMNDAFALATLTNLKITVAKTIDGALETAAQQRPNIG